MRTTYVLLVSLHGSDAFFGSSSRNIRFLNKLVVWEAVDTDNTSVSASGGIGLDETGSGWDVLVVREHLGRLWTVWRFSDGFSDDRAEKACEGKSFHLSKV